MNSHSNQALNVSELTVRHTSPPPAIVTDLDRVTEWPALANILVVYDQASYDGAVELLKADKALQNEAHEHHDETIKKAFAAHKSAVAMLKRVLEPLELAETIIKRKIVAWEVEQERLRREAEIRARLEAERLEAERLEAELEAIEASGAAPGEVAAIIQEAERTPVFVPVAQPTFQRAAGITPRENWSASVTSLIDLIKHCAMNPQDANLLMVNQPALNALARARKANLRLPGVRVSDGKTIGVR